MLGKYCYFLLKKKTKFQILLYDHSEFDITNHDDVYAMICNNDCIINCAAYTNVDKAESDVITCKNVNGVALDYLAHEINKQGKFLIHISSDFIYGDIKDKTLFPLCEDDIVNPINVYGESKLEGENNILAWMSSRFLILRVSWLFGPYGNNFVDKIYNQLIDSNVKELNVVNDQYGRLTSTNLIVNTIIAWLTLGFKSGFYNLQCDGEISTKYDIACEIRSLLNSDKPIMPISSSKINSIAKRQMNSILSCDKIDSQSSLKRSLWKNDLNKYIKFKLKNSNFDNIFVKFFKKLIYKF